MSEPTKGKKRLSPSPDEPQTLKKVDDDPEVTSKSERESKTRRTGFSSREQREIQRKKAKVQNFDEDRVWIVKPEQLQGALNS